MGSIPQATGHQAREEITIYDSRAFRRLRTFKQGLALDLFLRRGAFWELVRRLREERGITANVQLPPTAAESWMEPMLLLPANAPDYPGFRAPVEEKLGFYRFDSQWTDDIDSILSAVLPDDLARVLDHRIRDIASFYDRQYLRTFCAACVLYDPPETSLLEFAEYHAPRAHRAGHSPENPSLATKRVEMKMSPVEELPVRSDELAKLERFYESLLVQIARRLEPHRIDLRSMIEDIHREHPELQRELSEELERRFYIHVDAHMTERDAVRAYRTISATLPRSPADTKPRRNPLIAVQCAVLHDRHNKADASDRRRRLWTYKRLAEQFSLPSAQAAKDYVRLGRDLLKN